MGKFYLVDQSLKGPGGHHFDYTRLLAAAASESSWEVVVGCHRKFRPPESFDSFGVSNCFRHSTYASCSFLVGIQDMVSQRKPGIVTRVKRWFGLDNDSQVGTKRAQERRIQSFSADCHSLFQNPLTSDDIIFFTTISDLEVEGLCRFVESRTDAALANWHLQFHFPIYRGRTPEYRGQSNPLDQIKRSLQILRDLLGSQVFFYVTSDNLKDQYDRLGFKFEELAYPVNPDMFANKNSSGNNRPALPGVKGVHRITLAGANRHEKGQLDARTLSDQLASRLDVPFRLCVQAKRPKLLKRIENLFGTNEASPNIEVQNFPLSDEDYRSLISGTSVGLLTNYDSQVYFSRRAGILGEYLCAGIPVIVPAGSWLSDQLEPLQQSHLERLCSDPSIESDRHRPKRTVNHSSGATTATFEFHPHGLPDHKNDSELLILEFDVIKPESHGHYFRVDLSQPDGNHENVLSQVVGKGRQRTTQRVAFYGGLEASLEEKGLGKSDGFETEYTFQISPAFHSADWQIERVRLTHLRDSRPIPRSVVGLTAATPEQTASLALEMIRQYDHYRQSALNYSAAWFARHDPSLTFQTLVDHSTASKSTENQAA